MAGAGGSGVGHEQALLAFADAAVGATKQLAAARSAVLRELGEAAMLDAAAEPAVPRGDALAARVPAAEAVPKSAVTRSTPPSAT